MRQTVYIVYKNWWKVKDRVRSDIYTTVYRSLFTINSVAVFAGNIPHAVVTDEQYYYITGSGKRSAPANVTNYMVTKLNYAWIQLASAEVTACRSHKSLPYNNPSLRSCSFYKRQTTDWISAVSPIYVLVYYRASLDTGLRWNLTRNLYKRHKLLIVLSTATSRQRQRGANNLKQGKIAWMISTRTTSRRVLYYLLFAVIFWSLNFGDFKIMRWFDFEDLVELNPTLSKSQIL